MWWWRSGCAGFPWAFQPVRILSRYSRLHSQARMELRRWCCKVIATPFVFVLNEHFACLVNALLWDEVSYRNRNKDFQMAASSIFDGVRGVGGSVLWMISNLCIRDYVSFLSEIKQNNGHEQKHLITPPVQMCVFCSMILLDKHMKVYWVLNNMSQSQSESWCEQGDDL